MLVGLFEAARRPLAWVVAASVVAWLLSWVISVLDRWMPRRWPCWRPCSAFVVLVGGGWVGVRATIQSEVDKLRTALPRGRATWSNGTTRQPTSAWRSGPRRFVTSLDERFGTQAQVAAAAGTASTYIVAGVLMLFLVGYGPRFVSAGSAPDRRPGPARVRGGRPLPGVERRPGLPAHRAGPVRSRSRRSARWSSTCSTCRRRSSSDCWSGWLSAIPYLGIILGGLAPLLAAATEPHEFTYVVLVGLLVGLQLVEAW